MVTATLTPNGRQFYTGLAGLPLVGGKIYTYASGTNTPLPTYKNQAATVPNTNPVILDARGEATIYWTGAYKVVLKDALDNEIWTVDPVIDAASPLAAFILSLSASGGSATIGFLQAGPGAGLRDVQSKLRDSVSVKDFGAKGDAVLAAGVWTGTNDTAAINLAKNSGASGIIFPKGKYLTNGHLFDTGDAVMDVHFEPGAQLILISAQDAIALDFQKQVTYVTGFPDLRSTGDQNDGNDTVGVRFGNDTQGAAYNEVDRIRAQGFSKAGYLNFATVYAHLRRADIYSCDVGVWFDSLAPTSTPPNGGSTTVIMGSNYISGCRRGMVMDSVAWWEINLPIVESCGSMVNTPGLEDAGIHILNCANFWLGGGYAEQNRRNLIVRDSAPVLFAFSLFPSNDGIGPVPGPGMPDIVSYVGMEFDKRGVTQLNGNMLRIRKILGDNMGQMNLEIGDGIRVDWQTDRTYFGRTWTASTVGNLAAANVWETVATVTNQAGDGASRRSYRYAVHLGSADKTTGFDSGVVLNGVLTSDSAATPAWLQLSGNNIQLKTGAGVTDYGLTWGLTLYPMTAV